MWPNCSGICWCAVSVFVFTPWFYDYKERKFYRGPRGSCLSTFCKTIKNEYKQDENNSQPVVTIRNRKICLKRKRKKIAENEDGVE